MSVRWKTIGVVVACANVVVAGAQQHQPPGKPDHMQHRFDDPARFAKSFDDPARDRWQQPQLVLEALELGPGMVIADIGAGTGYFSVRLARAVPDGQVIATDIEPDMIAMNVATAYMCVFMVLGFFAHTPTDHLPHDQ